MAEVVESSPVDAVKHIGGIIVRGRWRILLIATIVSLATVAVLYQLPNRYTSEATLLVVPQQVPARYVTPTTETNIADALQAMTEDVLSRARLLELIDEFGLYAKERRTLAPEEILVLMRKYIDIKPVDPASGRKDINAFKISFIAEKAALAQQVTSKLTSFFIQANLKTREDQATNTTNFLQAQLDTAKQKLTEQESKVREFKAQYLGELPEEQPGNLAIFNGALSQLQNVENSLDRAQQQRVYLESLISGYQRLAAARGIPVSNLPGIGLSQDNFRQSSPADPLQIAQSDLARLKAQRAMLLSRDKPGHPDVIAVDSEISAEQAMIQNLQASADSKAAAAHDTALAKATPAGTTSGTTAGTPSPTATATTVAAKSPFVPEDDASITQLKSQLESNRLDIENLTKSESQEKAVIKEYQDRLNLTPVREQQLAGIFATRSLPKKTTKTCWAKNSNRSWPPASKNSRAGNSSASSNRPISPSCLPVRSASK